MAEFIASIAALTLVGTTFFVMGHAVRMRDKEMRRAALEAVVLEFKPRQRRP
ncbi:hypothetical protein [Rhizobium leucaenae]|jgi:hypothetical protein|uniref:Uncharacterized protein n=1 Tax=Rhizobium leucaenae TaxID=29450 RepID=A0A7W6ZTG0_9HYPH|nr:hypothetical protein [Rhizobium leucaenae]MBB4567880.1 hypothetical protein [Rhizobium leucaenae]MBB6301145.1 hypothetical protein [Rhizobium leucaenae]